MKTVDCTRALLAAGMMLCATAGAGDGLGVLFTTPEQRAALDAGAAGVAVAADTGKGETTGGGPTTLTLNGTLISSVGKKEVWVNGEPSYAGNARSTRNLRMLPRNRVRIRPEHASGAHVLKPGQVVNLGDGRVDETYNRKAPRITTEDPEKVNLDETVQE